MAAFDPRAYPPLIALAERLRELAGDKPYMAGRDYLKKGLVKEPAVAGTSAFAVVTGSTDYRVSVNFGDAEAKVSCTCPAHRRAKYCKHVVAVCEALVQQPQVFVVSEPQPEVQAPAAKRGGARSGKPRADKTAKAESQAAGLAVLDRLLVDLTAGGLVTQGPERSLLLESTGELVRALKLRRLGNLVLRLQRILADQGGADADDGMFAQLVTEIYLTRTVVGAHLAGQVTLDPALAEDLLGKTWREQDLEPVIGLELLEVAATTVNDGEFRIEVSYLADLATGQIYTDKQITPAKLWGTPKPRYRHRLLVDQAGLYPGPVPRRIRLQRVRRAPLATAEIERLLRSAATDVAVLHLALLGRQADPFAPAEFPVLFRPVGIVHQGSLNGALDGDGRFLSLSWPDAWQKELPAVLPEPGRYALFGLMTATDRGLHLQCLSVVGAGMRWSRGPVYPE